MKSRQYIKSAIYYQIGPIRMHLRYISCGFGRKAFEIPVAFADRRSPSSGDSHARIETRETVGRWHKAAEKSRIPGEPHGLAGGDQQGLAPAQVAPVPARRALHEREQQKALVRGTDLAAAGDAKRASRNAGAPSSTSRSSELTCISFGGKAGCSFETSSARSRCSSRGRP